MAKNLRLGSFPAITSLSNLNANSNIASFRGTKLRRGADGKALPAGDGAIRAFGDRSNGSNLPPYRTPQVVLPPATSNVFRDASVNVLTSRNKGLSQTDRVIT